jgi:hypothetical protein
MREAFKELDHDGRGSISLAEILEVLRDIDVANPDAPHSITGTVGKTLQSLDTTGDGTSNFGDDDGRITFEHFLAAVAAASAQSAEGRGRRRRRLRPNLELAPTAHRLHDAPCAAAAARRRVHGEVPHATPRIGNDDL